MSFIRTINLIANSTRLTALLGQDAPKLSSTTISRQKDRLEGSRTGANGTCHARLMSTTGLMLSYATFATNSILDHQTIDKEGLMIPSHKSRREGNETDTSEEK